MKVYIYLSCCFLFCFCRTPKQVDDLVFAVGTYTEKTASKGIYICRLDTTQQQISELQVISDVRNPSFLLAHHRTLYAVSEIGGAAEDAPQGLLYQLHLDKGFRLIAKDSQPTYGNHPCHLYKYEHRLGVANYSGGNVSFFSVDAQGKMHHVDTKTHYGKGAHIRQEKPHAHFVSSAVVSPRHVYAVDLGADKIYHYRVSSSSAIQLIDSSILEQGTGPRHLAFHTEKSYCYLVSELAPSVQVYFMDTATSRLVWLQSFGIRMPGYKGDNFPSGILLHPNNRFLYVLNRGQNTISIFEVSPEGSALALVKHMDCGGKWPRSVSIDPSGKLLFVANQTSDNVSIFRIEEMGRKLTMLDAKLTIPSPTHVAFFENK